VSDERKIGEPDGSEPDVEGHLWELEGERAQQEPDAERAQQEPDTERAQQEPDA
jgi:hypothetical protein